MITTRELATHIYNRVLEISEKKKNDIQGEINDTNEILYIQNLIELYIEPDNHLGSKGFVSISKENDTRLGYGC